MSEEPVDGLSDREREVLQLVVEGRANKEIAQALSMAKSTVKGHLESVAAKYQTKNRTESAIQWLRRTGRAE